VTAKREFVAVVNERKSTTPTSGHVLASEELSKITANQTPCYYAAHDMVFPASRAIQVKERNAQR
jgi:hypothetical protein